MLADATLVPSSESVERAPQLVTLSEGVELDIAELGYRDLLDLQWHEERAFAEAIRRAPKGSAERARVTAQAYNTVCTILRRRLDLDKGHLEMGYDRRYIQLVLDVLARQSRTTDIAPQVFEIGFGSGALLAGLESQGVDVSGIEVSSAMRDEACRRLPSAAHGQLYLGDFLSVDLPRGSYDIVFWNDVLEHIVTDETHDFLVKIRSLLKPGGALVTITPNWHLRPSDITMMYQPPRSQAVGFHMQEYTLREMTAMLRQAGFARVATPLVVTRGRMHLAGLGLTGLKRLLEPALECLPYRLTRLLCRGFGLSCTIGWK